MSSPSKEKLTEVWSRVWDLGDVDALDQICHPEYRRESASTGRTATVAEFKNDILDIRSAFPDLSNTLKSVMFDGDEGALFWESIGTFTNNLGGVPATGSEVTTRGSNHLQFQDGLILHERVTWDRTELLSDVGIPSLRSAFEDEGEVVVDDLSGSLDVEMFKGFNRQFITGVTVVTAIDEHDAPRGLAVNSYASVSLEPPLVLVCVQKTSSTYETLFKSSHLGINIMGNSQLETVMKFAGKDPDKFASIDWHAGPHGSPLVERSSASIEAEIKERYQAKTHTVFIAKVVHAELSGTPPMIYKAGQFYDGAEVHKL